MEVPQAIGAMWQHNEEYYFSLGPTFKMCDLVDWCATAVLTVPMQRFILLFFLLRKCAG